jgi:hypothetical protein
MLSLNAAYVAVVVACDALEHRPGHVAHFLHHSHDHGDDHNDQQVSAEEADNAASFNNHQHNHVHSGFSTILSDSIGIVPLFDDSITVSNLTEIFVSAPPSLLERPPRNTLA